MNTDEKILKALETLQADVTTMKGDITSLKQGQTHLTTAVEAVKAGQDDIRDTMATQAGLMDVGAKVEKITRNHERRIEELEKKADLPNPYKN